jgi:hypothetical protein
LIEAFGIIFLEPFFGGVAFANTSDHNYTAEARKSP